MRRLFSIYGGEGKKQTLFMREEGETDEELIGYALASSEYNGKPEKIVVNKDSPVKGEIEGINVERSASIDPLKIKLVWTGTRDFIRSAIEKRAKRLREAENVSETSSIG